MSTEPRLPWDLLVIANPVWESAWLLPELPAPGAIDFDPRPSALAMIEDGGGSALNTACALARAGRRVLAVGRVGDDAEGRASIAALERRGIHANIEIARARATKRNHLYVDARDRKAAFRAFLPTGCAPAWEETPREIALARILLLDRLAIAAPAWAGLRAEHRPRLLNAFNRNSPPFRGAAVARFREALPFLDYLQVSEGTADPRAGGAAEDAADEAVDAAHADPSIRGAIHSPPDPAPFSGDSIAAILGAGVGILARTRGARGVILHRAGSDPLSIPAIETDVVDPTGAGDAFAAGFLDVLLGAGPDPGGGPGGSRNLAGPDDAVLAEAARRGIDWGARACRHLGARGWLDREPPGGPPEKA